MTFSARMLPLIFVLTLFFAGGGQESFELTVLLGVGSICYIAEHFLRGSTNPYLRFSHFYLLMIVFAAAGVMYNIHWLVLGPLGIMFLHLTGTWLSQGDDD